MIYSTMSPSGKLSIPKWSRLKGARNLTRCAEGFLAASFRLVVHKINGRPIASPQLYENIFSSLSKPAARSNVLFKPFSEGAPAQTRTIADFFEIQADVFIPYSFSTNKSSCTAACNGFFFSPSLFVSLLITCTKKNSWHSRVKIFTMHCFISCKSRRVSSFG